MSRSWLFLGELLSSRARLRFTSRHHLHGIGCNCKPSPSLGGGIFDRRNAEISTGVDICVIGMVPDDLLKERTPRPEPGSTRLRPPTRSVQAAQKGEKLCPQKIGTVLSSFQCGRSRVAGQVKIGSAEGTEVPGS